LVTLIVSNAGALPPTSAMLAIRTGSDVSVTVATTFGSPSAYGFRDQDQRNLDDRMLVIQAVAVAVVEHRVVTVDAGDLERDAQPVRLGPAQRAALVGVGELRYLRFEAAHPCRGVRLGRAVNLEPQADLPVLGVDGERQVTFGFEAARGDPCPGWPGERVGGQADACVGVGLVEENVFVAAGVDDELDGAGWGAGRRGGAAAVSDAAGRWYERGGDSCYCAAFDRHLVLLGVGAGMTDSAPQAKNGS
jgi:hypothetical protein